MAEEGEGEGEGEEEEEEGREEDEEGSSESESDGEDFDPDALPESLQSKIVAPPTMSRLPPPPPPGPPPLFAPRFPPPGIGIPPGPPPGLPPGLRPPAPGGSASFPPPRVPVAQPHIQSQAVLSSLPPRQRTSSTQPLTATQKTSKESGTKDGQRAVISAQPQLRNIQAEVTKFMPTSLRVRREVPKPVASKMKAVKPPGQTVGASGVGVAGGRSKERGGLQGDAYEAFMKEMEGFL